MIQNQFERMWLSLRTAKKFIFQSVNFNIEIIMLKDRKNAVFYSNYSINPNENQILTKLGCAKLKTLKSEKQMNKDYICKDYIFFDSKKKSVFEFEKFVSNICCYFIQYLSIKDPFFSEHSQLLSNCQ